jgi:hypothetical protein
LTEEHCAHLAPAVSPMRAGFPRLAREEPMAVFPFNQRSDDEFEESRMIGAKPSADYDFFAPSLSTCS